MLQPVQQNQEQAQGGHFLIIASLYNREYVDSMLQEAKAALERAKVSEVKIIRVPGAFEIPVVAATAASSPNPPSAIIALGVVIRGETAHAQLIAEAASLAFGQIQILHHIPVIHGVLLVENQEQARVRCLDPKHNRGIEAAATALQMVQVMKELKGGKVI